MKISWDNLRLNDADKQLDSIFAELGVSGRVAFFDRLTMNAATRYDLRKTYLRYLRADAALSSCNSYSERNRLSLMRYTAMSNIVIWYYSNFKMYSNVDAFALLFEGQDWRRCIVDKEHRSVE